jgi:cytoskeletal protein CcmA (bactofilin family)
VFENTPSRGHGAVVAQRYECPLLAVPENEAEFAEYDWSNFPPRKNANGKTSFSVIDEFTGIDGKLITRDAFIHGQIKGLVFAENVTIEKTGRVNGIIFCRTLTLFGSARANIICDTILVHNGGLLSAVLKYRNLQVEPGGSVGGKFERRCVIDGEATAAPAQRPADRLLQMTRQRV